MTEVASIAPPEPSPSPAPSPSPTPAPPTQTYQKGAKLSDTFVTVFDGKVKKCSTTNISNCVTLPNYTDGNSQTAILSDAKLLVNGDVVVTGTIDKGSGVKTALALLWSQAGSSWSELDRFSIAASLDSRGVAIDVSPKGSMAYQVSGYDASSVPHFAVREWRETVPTWSTVDNFDIGTGPGDGDGLAYGEDESLFSVGTLYNASTVGTGCLRGRVGESGPWMTIDDKYILGGAETAYRDITVLPDKVVIVGWKGGGTRSLIIRDCSRSNWVCTTRKNQSLLGGDTYLLSVNWASGDSIYSVGMVDPSSARYVLVKYNYTSDTLTTLHTYQPTPGLPGLGSRVGFDSSGLLWATGSRYSVDFFVHTYNSSEAVANTYVYP